MKKLCINKILLIICLLFLTLPIYIFIFGFLKWYVSIAFSLILSICIYKVVKYDNIDLKKFQKKDIKYIIIVCILVFLWLLFSGIGNFSYQNSDFEVRNAVLRDLINYDWPVIFKLNNKMRNIVGYDSVGFVYYFSYWLVPALAGKIFSYTVANYVLFIESYLIILMIIYLLYCKSDLNILLVTLIFIFFSGLDILPSLSNIFDFSHIEWWNTIIQYSSNTTCLYWVYNQAIMTWLITILLLHLKKSSSIIFIGSLSFCYSPFVTLGIIPIVLYLAFKKIDLKKVKTIVSEIIFCLTLLVIYGSFYLAGDSTISVNGLIFNIIDISFDKMIIIYTLFIFVEFLLYFLLLYKDYKKDGLFILISFLLFSIPFYKITPSNDFCMRASIPSLFILMCYVLKSFNKIGKKKILMILILLVGSITGIHEIGRSVYFTYKYPLNKVLANKEIVSIANPITKDGIEICNNQFYSKNYKTKFFYKYLAK